MIVNMNQLLSWMCTNIDLLIADGIHYLWLLVIDEIRCLCYPLLFRIDGSLRLQNSIATYCLGGFFYSYTEATDILKSFGR